MTTSPTLELQGAIVTRLRNMTSVGARVYDQPPPEPSRVFPYISYGPDQQLAANAECLLSYEVSVQIDVWSQEVGYVEARQIAEEVRAALHDAVITLSVNALLMIEHQSTRTLRDPDGKTSHAVVEFLAIVEQPS